MMSQRVNMQSLPVIGVSVDKTLPLSEVNADSGAFIITLNKPAPVGGLDVNFEAVDNTDGIPGDVEPSAVNGTIQRNENNSPSGILIEEGATEAGIILTAVQDDVAEGEEISGLDLLPGDGYTIDPDNSTASFVVTDLPIVSFSVDRTIISEGGESQLFTFQLNEPAPDGGLTVKLEFDDPDGDATDAAFDRELFSNIANSEIAVENGKSIFKFTISEGAKSANFGIFAGEDNQVEGDETYTLTLLDDESYSIDSANFGIVSTVTEKEIINGTADGDILFGTDASEFIIGLQDDDTMFGNGGEDTLTGDEGNDFIFGGSQADTILASDGDDTIVADGDDLINSGTGEDTVWLGAGKATVILETGEGFDTINNFQLGATTFQVESIDDLSFVDSGNDAKIFQGGDLLAVVSWQSAHTFNDNQDSIFAVLS